MYSIISSQRPHLQFELSHTITTSPSYHNQIQYPIQYMMNVFNVRVSLYDVICRSIDSYYLSTMHKIDDGIGYDGIG